MEIKTAVGIAKRRRAQRTVFPLHLAGGELGAEQRLSSRAIQKIPDFHRAANGRGKFRFEIDLFRLDASLVDPEFDDAAAGAGRGAVDITVAGERRRDVCAVTADRFPVTPQKPARLRLHAHEALLQELNVLLYAANLDDDEFGDTGVRFGRDPNRHVAFGGGNHLCLGAHLARLEVRVALEEFHARIPDYRIAAGAELKFSPGIRQAEHLPIEWDV